MAVAQQRAGAAAASVQCCRSPPLMWLLALVLLALSGRSDGFVIVGYVPEYRFPSVDWEGIMSRTTHLVLFSAEPTADGDISGLDRFWLLRQTSSAFNMALKRRGSHAPKVLMSIGGQGRSEHFQAVTADKKLRRRLARRIVQLLVDYPVLAGIDLNWESPTSVEHWRNLAKLAHDIRERMASSEAGLLPSQPMLTMAYHPLTGSVEKFASIKGKATNKGLVDYFDLCHSMSYSLFDEQRRHATQKGSKMAIEEWSKFGLPASRMTLGMPFFGISKTSGHAKTWGEILEQEPSLRERTDVDESEDGFYFNNGQTLAKKVRFAMRRKLGGIMIWEVGQDKAASDPASGSLLRHVWDAAVSESEALNKPLNNVAHEQSYLSRVWDILGNQDHLVAGIAGIAGAYLLLKSLFFATPVRDRAPRGENDPPVEPSAEHIRIVTEFEDEMARVEEAEAAAAAAERKTPCHEKIAEKGAKAEAEAEAEGAGMEAEGAQDEAAS